MDLFQLKCFVNVVDQRSFTKAAFEVSSSQSALSKQISKLEDELNVRLFDRSRRVVTLTPAGREFEPHARKLLADYDEMMASIKRFSNSGHLHIGSVDHMGRVGLTTPISTFLKQYPDGGVTIDIERGTSLGVMDQLVAGKLDMAFIAHIISPFSKASNIDAYQLDHYRLYTLVVDNYHAIVSRRHRFAGLDVVTWQDLAEEKLVILDKSYGLNAIIRESFRQCGLRPNIAFERDQVDAILGMVEGNFGISILSKRIAATQYDVEAIPIDPPISRNTVLVVPKEVEARQRLCPPHRGLLQGQHPRPLRGAVASALRARAVPGILPPRALSVGRSARGALSVRPCLSTGPPPRGTMDKTTKETVPGHGDKHFDRRRRGRHRRPGGGLSEK